MSKLKIISIKLVIAALSTGAFWWLESGLKLRNGDELIKSVIFAASLFFVLTRKYKKSVLWLAVLLLGMMIIFYLLRNIPLASFFGSIGFGMLVIFVLSLIPDLAKRGSVEKL